MGYVPLLQEEKGQKNAIVKMRMHDRGQRFDLTRIKRNLLATARYEMWIIGKK